MAVKSTHNIMLSQPHKLDSAKHMMPRVKIRFRIIAVYSLATM